MTNIACRRMHGVDGSERESNKVRVATSDAAGFLYDAAGNVTYDGLNNDLFDGEGRLCAVSNFVGTVTGYIYDAAGIRVSKVNLNQFSCNLGYGYTPTSSYVLGLGGEQMTEFNVNSGVSTWAHTNVFSGGGLLATYSPTGNSTGSTLSGSTVRTSTYFALSDWLGTKRAEVGANGCVSTYASMPFGGGLNSNGNCTDPTEHHFTGKERDAESGLDYFGARYYASNMGRWMSPDWADKPEAVPYSSLDNPQSLNLYGYVLNNPLSQADPDGHCCCDKAKAWVAEHPRTAQAVGGVAKVAVGVGLVATIAGGNVPGSVVGVGLVVSGTLSAVGSVVSGVTDVAGAATNTNVEAAQKGLDGVSNLPALVTTAATGNVETGAAVGTLADAGQLAAKPMEALKNPATMADAAKTLSSTVDLGKRAASAVRNTLSPGPPPAPKPPAMPSCSTAGACK